MGLEDEVKAVLKSVLMAIYTGGFSQVAGYFTDPILIATYQVSASYGWFGAFFAIVIVLWLIIEDTREYVAMGLYAVVALMMLFIPLAIAIAFMVFSSLGLSYLGVKVKWG